MKIKSVLIAICSATVLFSSCEKAEMDKGGTGGGGMIDESYNLSKPGETTMDKGGTGGGGMVSAYSVRLMEPTSTVIKAPINVLRALDTNANLGVVSVKITNNDGIIVYSNNVDTNLTPSLQVNRADFSAGSYTITLSDKDGTMIVQDHFIVE